MENLDNLNEKIVDEVQKQEIKNIVIDTNEKLSIEEKMALYSIRRVKNPFKMLTVKDVMQDLGICETVAYRTFKRADFPSINIGKNNQVMLLAYLIWKMQKRV